MAFLCPFSSVDYLRGLSNLGVVDQHPELPYAVLQRKIPGSSYVDGIGPWPYRWISSNADIEVFQEGFRNLVSLCVVTHPGWEPSPIISAKANIRRLKEHYVFDPSKPTPPLSKRALRRLKDAEDRGDFEIVTCPEEQLVMADLYEQLKIRRHLVNGFFDMPRHHFVAITKLPGAIFFRVRDANGIGAMACGVIINHFLQILHFVSTEHGLKWNASYLMMNGLQHYVRENSLLLLTGGMPMGGSKGLSLFKERWANAFLPVYMLCVVNDQTVASKLATGCENSASYFPSYRYA